MNTPFATPNNATNSTTVRFFTETATEGSSPAVKPIFALGGAYVTTEAPQTGQPGSYVSTSTPRTGQPGCYVSTTVAKSTRPGRYIDAQLGR